MDEFKRRLAEWKEKILFGVILIVTLLIAFKAQPRPLPPDVGGGVADIDTEVRAAARAAAGIDDRTAEQVLRLLENPTEITPTTADPDEISRPFYDELDVYRPPGSSAWSLTVEQYEGLPPIRLEAPGFTRITDFDVPAGPRPALDRVDGFVPRDRRPVSLSQEEGSEFED